MPNLSIPVAYEIIRKTEEWYDKKSKKVKLRSPISKNKMVRERLLTLQRDNKVKFQYVLWDTWFSSAENFNFVHYDLKKQFIAALKSNRLVALSEEDRRQGKFQRVDELNIQAFEAIPVWLKGMDFSIKLTKHPDSYRDYKQRRQPRRIVYSNQRPEFNWSSNLHNLSKPMGRGSVPQIAQTKCRVRKITY